MTKAGNPCRSTAVGSDGYCSVHGASPRFDPVEMGRKAGIASGEARRELGKSLRERLRGKVEEHADELWQTFYEALTATDADGNPDHRARVQAATAVLAEAYGKPKVQTEEIGKPRPLVVLTNIREDGPAAVPSYPANVRPLREDAVS